MTEPRERVGTPNLDIDKFVEVFNGAPEGSCFHLVDGMFPAAGETEVIVATAYTAPLTDFVDVFGDKHREHYERAGEAETFSLPFELPAKHRYGFDSDMPVFRMGIGNVLVHDKKLPVRVLCLGSMGGPYDYWLVKETPKR